MWADFRTKCNISEVLETVSASGWRQTTVSAKKMNCVTDLYGSEAVKFPAAALWCTAALSHLHPAAPGLESLSHPTTVLNYTQSYFQPQFMLLCPSNPPQFRGKCSTVWLPQSSRVRCRLKIISVNLLWKEKVSPEPWRRGAACVAAPWLNGWNIQTWSCQHVLQLQLGWWSHTCGDLSTLWFSGFTLQPERLKLIGGSTAALHVYTPNLFCFHSQTGFKRQVRMYL